MVILKIGKIGKKYFHLKMINFDDVTGENTRTFNLKWLYIPDHL